MNNLAQLSKDYQRIEQAIFFLEDNASRQPELAEVAAYIGLSEYHFQRLFTRWAGISSKRFLQFLTKENAKALLARNSILSAAYEAGLSSPGRLHDLLVQTGCHLRRVQIPWRGRGHRLRIPSHFLRRVSARPHWV